MLLCIFLWYSRAQEPHSQGWMWFCFRVEVHFPMNPCILDSSLLYKIESIRVNFVALECYLCYNKFSLGLTEKWTSHWTCRIFCIIRVQAPISWGAQVHRVTPPVTCTFWFSIYFQFLLFHHTFSCFPLLFHYVLCIVKSWLCTIPNPCCKCLYTLIAYTCKPLFSIFFVQKWSLLLVPRGSKPQPQTLKRDRRESKRCTPILSSPRSTKNTLMRSKTAGYLWKGRLINYLLRHHNLQKRFGGDIGASSPLIPHLLIMRSRRSSMLMLGSILKRRSLSWAMLGGSGSLLMQS